MRTFKAGDKVKVLKSYPDPEIHGLEGIVIEIKKDGDFPILVGGLVLPHDTTGVPFWFFEEELELVDIEIPYDPTQQGDLEEDV